MHEMKINKNLTMRWKKMMTEKASRTGEEDALKLQM